MKQVFEGLNFIKSYYTITIWIYDCQKRRKRTKKISEIDCLSLKETFMAWEKISIPINHPVISFVIGLIIPVKLSDWLPKWTFSDIAFGAQQSTTKRHKDIQTFNVIWTVWIKHILVEIMNWIDIITLILFLVDNCADCWIRFRHICAGLSRLVWEFTWVLDDDD